MNYLCSICGEWHWLTDQTIIDEWNTVSVPPAPELKLVTLDPRTTALLVLDMETTICKSTRCLTTIVPISELEPLRLIF